MATWSSGPNPVTVPRRGPAAATATASCTPTCFTASASRESNASAFRSMETSRVYRSSSDKSGEVSTRGGGAGGGAPFSSTSPAAGCCEGSGRTGSTIPYSRMSDSFDSWP